MRAQVPGSFGHAVPLEIVRRGAHDPAHAADPNGGEPGIGQVPDPHADIDALLDHVDDPIEKQRADGDGGVAREVVGHDRQHVETAELHRRRQRQDTGRRRGRTGGDGLGLGDLGQDPATILKIASTRIGELDRTRGADEQPRADGGFERRDGAGDGGRAHAERARRSGEAAALGDPHEDTHSLQTVHGGSYRPLFRGGPE